MRAMDAPLLERGDALAALGDALAASRAGSGRVVLVTGEAGAGKTALVEAFVARHPEVRWLRGYCESLSTPRSLGPIHDFEMQLPAPLQASLRAEDDRRADFYRGLLHELGRAAEPAVLVLEDLHWADGATLDLVRHIGRRIRSHAALVILTARDDDLSWSVLAPVVGEIAATSMQRVQLQPLSRDAVGRMAAGQRFDAARLHAATGGNAFFVTEVLRGTGTGGDVPASVRDAVGARLRQLPAAARAFAQQVSIFPRHAPVHDLRELGIFDVEAADACITAGLLLLDGAVLRFRHEPARAAVEDSMPPARRLALHGQLLQMLAARPAGTVPLAHLAHHALQSADIPQVLHWAPAAAQEAAARGARREAAAHCTAALAHGAALPAQAQAPLQETLADAQFEQNLLEQAAASYRDAAASFAAAAMPGAQARCLAKRAMPLVRLLRNADAEQASAQALAVAQASGDAAAIGFALGTASYLRMLNRDYRLAIEAGEEATQRALAAGDQALLASAYKTTGAALIFLDYAAGCALLERSLAVADALQDGGVAAADAYLMLGTASGELHEFAAAERWLEEGIAFARSRDLDRQALYMEAWQALCDLYAGRWDAAGERAQAVLAGDPQPSTTRVVALVTLGRLRIRRGDPGAAEVLDEALALASRSQTLQRLGPVCAARAEAAWLRDAPDDVKAEVARVWDLAVAKGQPWLVGELAYWRRLAGDGSAVGAGVAPPYHAELRDDVEGAADAWLARGCPYEAARALARGPAAAQVQALKLLDPLDARPLAGRVRLAMRNAGLGAVPRGPVAATRANPAGLTRRELQVLQLLAGNLRNQDIAASLSRSVRTVDHHVESLFAKLEVTSRGAAVARARALGLVHEK